MRIQRLVIVIFVGLLAWPLLTTTASAQMVEGEMADAAIAYRQGIMQSMQSHAGAISNILKSKVPHTGHLAGHAAAMAAMVKMYDDIFPKGSEVGATRLKAEFFTNMATAEGIIKKLQAETMTLAEVAKSGDPAKVGPQLGKVFGQCGACHGTFRK